MQYVESGHKYLKIDTYISKRHKHHSWDSPSGGVPPIVISLRELTLLWIRESCSLELSRDLDCSLPKAEENPNPCVDLGLLHDAGRLGVGVTPSRRKHGGFGGELGFGITPSSILKTVTV